MTTPGHNHLADLAERVRGANAAMHAASREAAERALEAGRLLIEAKEECRHGEWLPFLERAGLHERQARRLKQLVRSGLKSDTVSDLGIKGALERLAKWKLPNGSDVFMVTDGPLVQGVATVWVWDSEAHPGHFHCAGVAPELAFFDATCKPVSREVWECTIGRFVRVFENRLDDLQFATLPSWACASLEVPFKNRLEDFREAILKDHAADPTLERARDVLEQATARVAELGR